MKETHELTTGQLARLDQAGQILGDVVDLLAKARTLLSDLDTPIANEWTADLRKITRIMAGLPVDA